MAEIKQLNGGAVLRIFFSSRGPNLNKIKITDDGSLNLVKTLSPSIPSNNNYCFEAKIPLEEMTTSEGNNNVYLFYIDLEFDDGNSDQISFDLYDLPNGGDGTWHYYRIDY